MSRFPVRFALVLGLLMGALTWAAVPAQAAAVSGCYSNQAQLQSAITDAGPGGTVTFTCDASITLASTITLASVTIDGNGYGVTISGNNTVRVFSVSPSGNVVLKGLNLIDGNAGTGRGGAIFAWNESTLSVIDSTLSGNTGNAGGAIYQASGGILNVSGSTLSGNTGNFAGGAIYASSSTTTISNSQLMNNTGTSQAGAVQAAYGSLTISGSTFSGNTSRMGGAVLTGWTLVAIADSTVSGNSSETAGGVVDVRNGTATMTNSTVSGNTGRPVLVAGGSLVATNITVVGNTVYDGTSLSISEGSVTLANSILAGAGPGRNCQLYNVVAFVNGGGNLANDASCTNIPQVTTAALNLGPLADNGGPTRTHALLDGSAAIGAGVSSICNAAPVNGLDQRGSARLDTSCDSGAYDTGTIVSSDTTPPNVTVTGIADGAVYTLGAIIPTAGCDTTDDESGVATAATLDSSGGPLGQVTLTCDGAVDNAGNVADPVSVTYYVNYDWDGFFSPIDNQALNVVKAGAGVPVKFSLGGDQGLAVVSNIRSTASACEGGEAGDEIETVAAGSSSLQYDPATGEYTYVWKTAKSWSGACRQLTLTLADGTTHTASFMFR